MQPAAFPGMMQLFGCCARCTPGAGWGMPLLSINRWACLSPRFSMLVQDGLPLEATQRAVGLPALQQCDAVCTGGVQRSPRLGAAAGCCAAQGGEAASRGSAVCCRSALLAWCGGCGTQGGCWPVNCNLVFAELAVAATAQPAPLNAGGGPAEATHPGLELWALALC